MSLIEFKGSKWYKCDLHLHTTASQCFQDQAVSAKEWVERAIQQGLDCVAVTDHNTGVNIDLIKAAAKEFNLVVFPGVEITCDTSKIHLLILFDVDKSSADIRDFLVRADIKADDFGKQTASTNKSIFEITKLAQQDGAIVIPAHIDEYNGLESVSVKNLEQYFTEYNIKAVQVVHSEFTTDDFEPNNNHLMKQRLNDYYNNPKLPIDDSVLKKWYTPVKIAKEKNLALLTFSDNPHEPKNPKHGLWGIGQRFTWIKMDECINLESLRQAFLLPESRIKNDFLKKHTPYKFPDLWIKSISIENSTLTQKNVPLKINFNPQMNTIIGGRGSGKSSVLRFIRGVFNRTLDLNDLREIIKDHEDFYKKESGKPLKGVLNENTIIEIEIVRNSELHKVTASSITNSEKQSIKIEKLNSEKVWTIIQDEFYIDFFQFEHYSQKQIYEIAQEPNALRERIDNAIPDIQELKNNKEIAKKEFLEKSASIRKSESILLNKGKIETKIRDIESNIHKLKESGISDLLASNQKFTLEQKLLENFYNQIKNKEVELDEFSKNFKLDNIDFENFDTEFVNELSNATKKIIDDIHTIKESIEELKLKTSKLKDEFLINLKASTWLQQKKLNAEQLQDKKIELEEEGLDLISDFEQYNREKEELENQLTNINTHVVIKAKEIEEKNNYLEIYTNLTKDITTKRKLFLDSIVTGDKIKVNIKPFRNRMEFETRLRKVLQREGETFQTDIDKLLDFCFKGNVEFKIKELRSIILQLKNDDGNKLGLNGNFVNFIKSLNDAQIDEIEIILPEDEIEIQYKSSSLSSFKSLSTASAGQKTTAILTFILSYGNLPLILDQPEDDLDNRLVYELIVERLKIAKEKRQLIIVTHNANIPVNGDAELIISMNTESKYLQVLYEGTVDKDYIKKEICDVMEGGETAFEMRSLRYKK